jgi:hypothetical protein
MAGEDGEVVQNHCNLQELCYLHHLRRSPSASSRRFTENCLAPLHPPQFAVIRISRGAFEPSKLAFQGPIPELRASRGVCRPTPDEPIEHNCLHSPIVKGMARRTRVAKGGSGSTEVKRNSK